MPDEFDELAFDGANGPDEIAPALWRLWIYAIDGIKEGHCNCHEDDDGDGPSCYAFFFWE